MKRNRSRVLLAIMEEMQDATDAEWDALQRFVMAWRELMQVERTTETRVATEVRIPSISGPGHVTIANT